MTKLFLVPENREEKERNQVVGGEKKDEKQWGARVKGLSYTVGAKE